MDYSKQRAKSHIPHSTEVACIDGRTAGEGWRREAVFDRERQDWFPGGWHTVPKVIEWQSVTYRLCQN